MKVKINEYEVEITATCDGEDKTEVFLNHLANYMIDSMYYNYEHHFRGLATSASEAYNSIYDTLKATGYYDVK